MKNYNLIIKVESIRLFDLKKNVCKSGRNTDKIVLFITKPQYSAIITLIGF